MSGSPLVELINFVYCTVQYKTQCEVHYQMQCAVHYSVLITGCKKGGVPFSWKCRYSLLYSTVQSKVYRTVYSVQNSEQCSVQFSFQYSICLLGVQTLVWKRYQRERERDRGQSLLGQIFHYGSNVAILAQLTFKLETQVPQL